jgi:hypothetical protein
MKHSKLTTDLLKRVLDYDPATGFFAWKVALSKRVRVGERAGAIGSNGRRYLAVLGEKHLAHRLAWFYQTGSWPTGNIVPKNGHYDDVSFENLSEETVAETAQKGVIRSSNTSGYKGVSWSTGKGKWVATLTHDHKRHHLGYFDTSQDASAAYERALEIGPQNLGAATPTVQAIGLRRRIRREWDRVRHLAAADSGWQSLEIFAADVGDRPSPRHALMAVDDSAPIGPKNFAWVESESVRVSREPEYFRERDLMKSFGLSVADYQKMFLDHNGVCACCGKPETATRSGKTKWLAVDHDHKTGAIRGLLCSDCNTGLGKFCDSIEILTSAISYLKRYAPKTDAENVVALVKKESA